MALGNHPDGPAYCFYPKPEEPKSLAAVDLIAETCGGRKIERCTTDEIEALVGGDIRTAVVALYGTDRAKAPVLAIGRHPKLRFGQAATMLLAMIHQENERQRTGSS